MALSYKEAKLYIDSKQFAAVKHMMAIWVLHGDRIVQ